MRAKLDPPTLYFAMAEEDAKEWGVKRVVWDVQGEVLEGRCDGELIIAIHRIPKQTSLQHLTEEIASMGSSERVGILVARVATLEHQLQLAVEKIVELQLVLAGKS